jgi:gamma-glutamylputrescine oxidase
MGGDDHFALNYWRNNNRGDGRLLFGSLCDTYSFPSSFISWRLRNALSEVYPHLSNVKFDHLWGGKLAVALNAMPIIGRDTDYDDDDSNNLDLTENGVWYSTGFSGHGTVPTALAGSVIANAILGIPDRVGVADKRMTPQQQQQLWQLFHTYFPPSSWNGYPFSRVGAGAAFLVYNAFDWLGKKGVPVPRLPEIW